MLDALSNSKVQEYSPFVSMDFFNNLPSSHDVDTFVLQTLYLIVKQKTPKAL